MTDYEQQLAAEGRHWGNHLQVETSGELYSWLEHPLIRDHYQTLARVDGVSWATWVTQALGGPAQRSFDLGCGAGGSSLYLHQLGVTRHVEGADISADRVAHAERTRIEIGAPGGFWVGDANTLQLPPQTYDLIFSVHSFHHFLALEHVMQQVHDALTPDGFFVLEEYVGPTQFQWTDEQLGLVRGLLAILPLEYRRLRYHPDAQHLPPPTPPTGMWDSAKMRLRPFYRALRGLPPVAPSVTLPTHKLSEDRPPRAMVEAVSPFESIRSGEIVPLFKRYFEVVALRPLGGTLQLMLYNGIIHNFSLDDPQARTYIEAIYGIEDMLIDRHIIPSDCMLLIGRRRTL